MGATLPESIDGKRSVALPLPSSNTGMKGSRKETRRCCSQGRQKYLVLAFCFLANVVCFVDRTNIAVAALAIQDEYGWSDSDMGVALSSFFYGYAAMQIPSGWLSTKFGGKRVLAVCVALWSMFTIITPLAVHVSFGTLLAARIGMGLAEAASMPCVHSIIGLWFPQTEISFAISFSTSGQAVGTIIALISSPMVSWYWPFVFYFYGIIGLVWTVFFSIFCPGVPTTADRQTYSIELVDRTRGPEDAENGENDTTSSEEVDHWTTDFRSESGQPTGVETTIQPQDLTSESSESSDGGDHDATLSLAQPSRKRRNVAAVSQSRGKKASQKMAPSSSTSPGRQSALKSCISTVRVLCRPSFIAIIVAHMTHNYGYYVTLMWLPAYFTSLGIDLGNVGFVTLLPYIAIFFFDSSWSKLMDKMLQQSNEESMSGPSFIQRRFGCFSRILCPKRFAASKASRQERGSFHLLVIRKLSQVVAFASPTLFLSILISLTDVSLWAATVLMCLGLGLNSASHSGYWANLIDLGHPDHAGFLCGVSNTFATIPGVIGNLVTGWILDASGSWSMVFIAAMGNFVFGLIFYTLAADAVPLKGLATAVQGSGSSLPH